MYSQITVLVAMGLLQAVPPAPGVDGWLLLCICRLRCVDKCLSTDPCEEGPLGPEVVVLEIECSEACVAGVQVVSLSHG